MKYNNLYKYDRRNIFEFFLSPAELTNDIKKIIKDKLTQRYLFKEIDGRMITSFELNNLKNIPLSKSSINTIELNIKYTS